MKVSIIIPNYNGEGLLQTNIPKVVDALKFFVMRADNQGEILIVDDASTDQSISIILSFVKKINEERIKIILIKNEKNLGFAASVNKGVEQAWGEIIVLLNTDVQPEKNFLTPLIRHFDDQKVFGVGCMDRSIENGKEVLRGRGIGKWQKGFLQHQAGSLDKTDTLWASGGSSAFRKSLWDLIGGFNEVYSPFYWEDIDLSYRALKSGFVVLFEKMSIVVHEHEKGSIRRQYSDYEIKKIAYRNQFIFVWVNVTDLNTFFFHALWLPYHFFKALLHFDFAFYWGFLSACRLLTKVKSTRANNKKLFVKTDKEVIAAINI